MTSKSQIERLVSNDPHCQEQVQTRDVRLKGQSLIVQDAAFSWSDSTQAESTSALSQICLSVQAGSLVVVLGEASTSNSKSALFRKKSLIQSSRVKAT